MFKIQRNLLGKIALLTIFFAVLMVLLSACGDMGTTTAENNSNNVTVSVKADDNAMGSPAGIIVITGAKALVTEAEFEKESTGENVELHMAPFVINFDLNGGLTQILSAKIAQGNFNKVKFQIHKPEENEQIPDPEFREGAGSNQRYSFIIKGTYNGLPFVYKSKKSVNLIINFNSTINLQNSNINVTMLLNKLGWFKSGNIELDPADPQNENTIDDNLKNSFKGAFEDDDHDGHPDH